MTDPTFKGRAGLGAGDLIEQLNALHVWPQFVADHHADVLLPRQSQGLYAVGAVATQAVAELTRLRAENEALREALKPFAEAAKRIEYYDGPDYQAPLYASRTGHLLLELLDGIDGGPVQVSHLQAARQLLGETK